MDWKKFEDVYNFYNAKGEIEIMCKSYLKRAKKYGIETSAEIIGDVVYPSELYNIVVEALLNSFERYYVSKPTVKLVTYIASCWKQEILKLLNQNKNISSDKHLTYDDLDEIYFQRGEYAENSYSFDEIQENTLKPFKITKSLKNLAKYKLEVNSALDKRSKHIALKFLNLTLREKKHLKNTLKTKFKSEGITEKNWENELRTIINNIELSAKI